MDLRRPFIFLGLCVYLCYFTFTFIYRGPYGFFILFDTNDTLPGWLYSLSELTGHSASSINPIIYAIFNPSMRKGYKIIIKKLFCITI